MKKFLSAPSRALSLCALRSRRSAIAFTDGAWQFAVDRGGKLTINHHDVLAWRRFATNTRRLLDEMIRLVAADGFEPKLTIE